MTALHATYYGRHWDLGPLFGADIAEGIAVARYDPDEDDLWTLQVDGAVRGGVVDGRVATTAGAQVRYVPVAPDRQGESRGRASLEAAMAFRRRHGYDRVSLWTVDELAAAVHLSESVGSRPTDDVDSHTGWRTDVPYRRFVYGEGSSNRR